MSEVPGDGLFFFAKERQIALLSRGASKLFYTFDLETLWIILLALSYFVCCTLCSNGNEQSDRVRSLSVRVKWGANKQLVHPVDLLQEVFPLTTRLIDSSGSLSLWRRTSAQESEPSGILSESFLYQETSSTQVN